MILTAKEREAVVSACENPELMPAGFREYVARLADSHAELERLAKTLRGEVRVLVDLMAQL